jgi:hypothetical protein
MRVMYSSAVSPERLADYAKTGLVKIDRHVTGAQRTLPGPRTPPWAAWGRHDHVGDTRRGATGADVTRSRKIGPLEGPSR